MEMAEVSATNSDNKVEHVGGNEMTKVEEVKCEMEEAEQVKVKVELLECVVCATRCSEYFDVLATSTAAAGSLHHFLCTHTPVDVAELQCSKVVCKTCLDLINILETAEIEYLKLKDTFENIINKNPLYNASQSLTLARVKTETCTTRDEGDSKQFDIDSEDEPLAKTKKKRHHKVEKRKKKNSTSSKYRTRIKIRDSNGSIEDESWACDECDVSGEVGGAVAEAAHKLALHTLTGTNLDLSHVKTEESADRSQSPLYDNNYDNVLEIQFDNLDDDSSNFAPEVLSSSIKKKSKKVLIGRPVKTKLIPTESKTKKNKAHQCDQCDAKYTSMSRLERHKLTHDGSKPPYICEVCGAHYKHKRACDIHVAMHKGISDWKCEECNKLFPSKNALTRHNNIHTGKLNYQCDLCGKSFIHTSSFKMHKLSHTGLKPHACDVCGLALMTRSHLKRHKRVHSGEKRHECAVCGKRFSERYNLAAHSKAHDAPDPPRERRPRLFRCSYCPERFERRYMLERHTSAAHGRTLERPPATPRNTMSKLLKAQAQQARRAEPAPDAKPEPALHPPPKLLIAQLSSTSSLLPTTWSGAYAAEFGLRDFPH